MPTPRRRVRVLIDSLECRQLFAAILADVGAQPTGPLTGKIVYTSGGHGFTANSAGVFSTQRGLTNSIVEDTGNQDQLTYFADAAWRAGATVVPMRPVGHQLNEAVVDNVDATYSGTWNVSTNPSNPYYSTSNGAGDRYRYAATSTTETAVATFTPTLAATGYYPVYAWAAQGSDRAADQTYRVNHDGGATEVKVNHSLVGNGWVYLGTYYFTQGTGGNVQVSNRSATTGKVVIADAIRFGNGMGDAVRNGHTSGRSREDEESLYWIEAQRGWLSPNTRVATTIYSSASLTNDTDRNVAAPSKWAAYMNSAPFGQSVYLGFHSNASGGTGTQVPRGTEGLYNDTSLFPGTGTKNQKALAGLLGNEITKDLVSIGSPPLEYPFANNPDPTYARSDYAFGEIRGDSTGNEFDATIVEVAYHDAVADAALLRDPVVREKVAESSTQALIRYFNTYGSGAAVAFAPDAPSDLRTSVDASGNVTLRWGASKTSANFGGMPTGYRIYSSRDGYGFDGGLYVAGGTTLLATIPAAAVGANAAFFKVVGVNAGGESLPTTVAAVKRGDAAQGRVLIVNAFDRLDRGQNVVESLPIGGTNNTTFGTGVNVERVRPRAGNSFDYAVQHAIAIGGAYAGVGFDTVDDEAVDFSNVNLGSYTAVIWIDGEESVEDKTFDVSQQRVVAGYVAGGGRLLTTGSEIGYDLVGQNHGASFYTNYLHAGYAADSAGTHAAAGVANSIFGGVGSLQFGFDDTSYNVDFPDVLKTASGSSAVLNYSGGTGGVAATAWAASNGGRTVTFGFGFETIVAAASRTALMKSTLDFFGVGPTRVAGKLPTVPPSTPPVTSPGGNTPPVGGLSPVVTTKPPVTVTSSTPAALAARPSTLTVKPDDKTKASRAAVLVGLA